MLVTLQHISNFQANSGISGANSDAYYEAAKVIALFVWAGLAYKPWLKALLASFV